MILNSLGHAKTNNVLVPCQKNHISLLGGKVQVSVSNNLYVILVVVWSLSRVLLL